MLMKSLARRAPRLIHGDLSILLQLRLLALLSPLLHTFSLLRHLHRIFVHARLSFLPLTDFRLGRLFSLVFFLHLNVFTGSLLLPDSRLHRSALLSLLLVFDLPFPGDSLRLSGGVTGGRGWSQERRRRGQRRGGVGRKRKHIFATNSPSRLAGSLGRLHNWRCGRRHGMGVPA